MKFKQPLDELTVQVTIQNYNNNRNNDTVYVEIFAVYKSALLTRSSSDREYKYQRIQIYKDKEG